MSLDDLRKEIDTTDKQIVELLRQRADIARRVGEFKRSADVPVYDPAREADLLRRIGKMPCDPLAPPALVAIYREIINGCRALQEIKAAYLGPIHTNTYLAAVKQFGTSAELIPCRSIEEIFDVTERGDAQLGIVPIENSLHGVVGETCDRLVDTSLVISAEMYLPVHHALLSNHPMDEIKVLYSHPQVFGQCRQWLREHMPGVEEVTMSSTAAAAERAASESGAGALAPQVAADAHELDLVAENIEDRPDNRTRFFVVGHRAPVRTGMDKTSIVFAVPHEAGSLHDALGPLHRHSINLTLIQSRPAKSKLWEYVFFVDFEGHESDEKVQGALADLRHSCPHVKILGSYPVAE